MSLIRSTRRCAVVLAAGAALLAGAVGCSSGAQTESKSAAPAGAAPAQRNAVPAQGGAADQAGGTGTTASGNAQKQAPGQLVVNSRSLIFTGTVTVVVPDVERAAAAATSLATAAGGFVGGDDRSSGKARAQARMTLRVPSAQFTSVVDSVGKLGREDSRQLSSQDVTDEVTDVDARIATGQAGVDRVRELIAKAQSMSDIVSLENELSRREGDLESLKSRKSKLDDLTTLSTITAVLLAPEAAAARPHKRTTGFLAGLAAGWHSFTASMAVLSTVVGALLPWLAALAVPGGFILWWLRRSRRPQPATE